MIGNFGFAGILIFLYPIITFILLVSGIAAIFQIRNETRRMSDKLAAIYELLLEHKQNQSSTEPR